MEQTFDCSILNQFLYQTLLLTEEVKNLLKLNCNEAIFSLKPWRMEMMIKQEIDTNACICSKPVTTVEEIAAGISKALLQTQQLREKLLFNTIKGKKCQKQPSISEIYNRHIIDAKERKGVKTIDPSKKKLPSVKESDINKLNDQKRNLDKGLQIHTVEQYTNTNSEDTMSKQVIRYPKKIMKNKNFLAINKQNIKNSKEIRKLKNINYDVENNSKFSNSITKTKCVELDRRSSAASTNELKSLIHKMSSESNDCAASNMNNTKCPLHGDITSQFTYKQDFITMDVIDSLNAFNIPGEIIISLKIYHTYLNNEFSDKSLKNEKQQRTRNKFLTEFNKMDKNIKERLTQNARVKTILIKFMCLFQNLFSEDIKISEMTNFKKTYTELNSMWKVYDTKEFYSLRIWKSDRQKKVIYNNSNATKWMSNGIWNHFYARNFEGMSRTQCMYYTNDNQLVLFFEIMQHLQQILYSNDLIEIIVENILPNMKMCFDPTKPEYVKMYKVICILCQGLNPKIPILVKTDK